MAYDENDSVSDSIKAFIETELSYGLDDVDPAGDLIEQGVIDSMNLLRLISFMEEKFEIQIPDQDVIPSNFHSLDSITAYINRMQHQQTR